MDIAHIAVEIGAQLIVLMGFALRLENRLTRVETKVDVFLKIKDIQE